MLVEGQNTSSGGEKSNRTYFANDQVLKKKNKQLSKKLFLALKVKQVLKTIP